MDKSERKEIPFPGSGKMWVRYSIELAKALCGYLISQGKDWDAFELKRYGIIKVPWILENKIEILQIIHIEESRYVCKTIFIAPLGRKKQRAIEHRIGVVEELNAKIGSGEFSLSGNFDGIFFVTTYEPDGQPTDASLAEFLDYPKQIINKYGHLF